MTDIKIYSAVVCPYAHRTRLVLQESLRKLSVDGPYWFGESISLVDFTFFPWFERWAALKHYRDFGIPAEFTRLKQWKHALKEREAVKAIAKSKEFYIERYAKFATPVPLAA